MLWLGGGRGGERIADGGSEENESVVLLIAANGESSAGHLHDIACVVCVAVVRSQSV
jgi:hypothetical protein